MMAATLTVAAVSSVDSGNPRISQLSLLSTKTCLNLLRDGLFSKKQTGHRFQAAVSLLEL